VLRDPTRGGLATTLNEIALQSRCGIEIAETALPVDPAVASGCSFLGLDPLYLANEGKLICILPEERADKALALMRKDPLGARAVRIGTVTAENPGKVIMLTGLGGRRLLGMLEGEQLPRIC
jgi:hydrogenase expression/formation protein HypE